MLLLSVAVFIKSMIPILGNGSAAREELISLVTTGEMDELNFTLSVIGLAMDSPLDAGFVGDTVVATLKAFSVMIPAGPARDILLDLVTQAAKNPEEISALAGAVWKLFGKEDLIKVLAENPNAFKAFFEDGTEAAENILKHEDELIQLGKAVDEGTLKAVMEASDDALKSADEIADFSRKNIDEFIEGSKSFDDVVDDYANIYADKVNSNKGWSWDHNIPGGEDITSNQRSIIMQKAVENGLISDITVTKVDGMRYGFADFTSAGVVKETVYLPEDMWKLKDSDQFYWLDIQIGGKVDGYTWHHTETPGKMELIPTGIHNVTTHNGGRTVGIWADAPR